MPLMSQVDAIFTYVHIVLWVASMPLMSQVHAMFTYVHIVHI